MVDQFEVLFRAAAMLQQFSRHSRNCSSTTPSMTQPTIMSVKSSRSHTAVVQVFWKFAYLTLDNQTGNSPHSGSKSDPVRRPRRSTRTTKKA